jgi:hypothetical protein
MSISDVLPILIPISGAVIVFSISTYCCLRRQLRGEYNSLEYRIKSLEQQITTKSQDHITSQQYTTTTYSQYPTYSQFPPPTAPNGIIYGAPPATNPYAYTA